MPDTPKSTWDRHKEQWAKEDERRHRAIVFRPSKQERDREILDRLKRVRDYGSRS